MKYALVASVLFVASCGGGKAAPPPEPPKNTVETAPAAAPPPEPKQDDDAFAKAAIAGMVGFKDQMCACKDKACANTVHDGFNKWSTEMATKGEGSNIKPSEEAMKQMTDAGMAYGECMTKAMTPPVVEAADAIAAVKGFETETCSCKNADCGVAVLVKYDEWEHEHDTSALAGNAELGKHRANFVACKDWAVAGANPKKKPKLKK